MTDSKAEPIPCRNTDVANLYEAIAISILLFLEIFIFAFIVNRMIIFRKYRVPKSVLIYVYGLMILWGVTYTTEYSMELISYFLTSHIDLYKNYPFWYTDVMPRFNVFLDLMAPIIINTLLLIVPYFWIRNILFFLQHSESLIPKKTKIFNKASKLYIITTRILIIPPMFMIFFIPIRWVDQYDHIIRLILISETFLIGLYLFAGYKILNKKFKMLAEASKKQTRKIRMESGCLIFICFLRCLQNVVMNILSSTSTLNQKLRLRRWIPELCKYMVDLVFALVLMHFVPIGTILYIYKPEHQQEQNNSQGDIHDSLISSTV